MSLPYRGSYFCVLMYFRSMLYVRVAEPLQLVFCKRHVHARTESVPSLSFVWRDWDGMGWARLGLTSPVGHVFLCATNWTRETNNANVVRLFGFGNRCCVYAIYLTFLQGYSVKGPDCKVLMDDDVHGQPDHSGILAGMRCVYFFF